MDTRGTEELKKYAKTLKPTVQHGMSVIKNKAITTMAARLLEDRTYCI